MKLFLFSVFFFSFSAVASKFLPENFLTISPDFSKSLIIAEKTKLKLHIFEVNGTKIKKIKSFPMAYGKSPGAKKSEGDKKTPDGIYFLNNFHRSEELIRKFGNYGKIYGAGAFTLNYPNAIDLMQGKTGDGIWLHSTDDESRIAKGLDSRGCLVVNDKNLKEISKYIDIYKGTPIVVVQDMSFIDKETQGILNKNLRKVIDTWALSWKTKDINKYLSVYHKDYKSGGNGMTWFKSYKTRVFNRTKFINLQLANYTALQFKEYAVVTINQFYESNLVKDQGLKTLYLKKNSRNEWRIISEKWSRDKKIRSISRTENGELSYF